MELARINFFRGLYRMKHNVFAVDSTIRNYIFFAFFAILRLLHFPGVYSDNEKKIKQLQNSNLGKRCFIIAPGPSLTKQDVEKLKDEVSFAVNKAFKIYKEWDWKPNYYALLDYTTISKYRSENINFDINECARDKIFLTHLLKRDITEKCEKILYIHTCHLDNLARKFNKTKLRYSKNILWGHYSANTVTNFAINVAEYMGFDEIYLLGVDCNYSGNKQYFDNSKNSDVVDTKTAELIREGQILGYELMKKEAEKRGIKIYNATRGGALEVFERVDFDSLF